MCGKFIFIFTRRPRDFLVVDVHDNFLFFTMRPQDFHVVGLCDNNFNFYHETMYYQITMYYCIILWAIIVKFTRRRRASRDEKAQNGQCWNYLTTTLQPLTTTYNHLPPPTTTYNHLPPPTTTYNHLQRHTTH